MSRRGSYGDTRESKELVLLRAEVEVRELLDARGRILGDDACTDA